jgi:hypothetical protein
METMLDCMHENGSYSSNVCITCSALPGYLSSCHAEKLNSIYSDAFGYNKRLFGSTLEAALMTGSVNGENIAW